LAAKGDRWSAFGPKLCSGPHAADIAEIFRVPIGGFIMVSCAAKLNQSEIICHGNGCLSSSSLRFFRIAPKAIGFDSFKWFV